MPFFPKKRDKSILEEESGYRYPYFPEAEEFKRNLEAAEETHDLAEMALGFGKRAPKIPELPESDEGTEAEEEKMPELPELPEEGEETEETIPRFQKKESEKKPRLREEKKPELRDIKGKRPLFIKIDKFKEILASVSTIEHKIKATSDIIQKLKQIRQEEVKIMQDWEMSIQELKARLDAITKNLSQIEE
jgi:hypothetical protein